MAAQVRALEVSVDGQSWNFELDSRHGTASVEIDGERYTLRVQSWREKRLLARFAHLGEAFLEDQFLRLCLSDGEPPRSGPQREALVALALWLNASGGTPGLPLDQQLLAGVTLQVCQAIHASPQTFDALDAADVELFWRAVRAGAPMPAEDQPANRILVVPDATALAAKPTPTTAVPAAPDIAGEDRGAPADARPARAAAAQAAREPSPGTASQAIRSPDAIAVAHPAKAAPHSTPVAATPRLRESQQAPRSVHGASRFRVLPEPQVERPPQRAASMARHRQALAAIEMPPPGGEALAAAPGAENAPPLLPEVPGADREARTWLQPRVTSAPAHPSRSTSASDRFGRDPHQVQTPSAVEDGAASHGFPAAASPQPPADHDAIFDELAARLEQAAAEQGIDLET